MYVDRRHFIQGLISYDVDAAETKLEATEKYIQKRHKISFICNVITVITGLGAFASFFVGNFFVFLDWARADFDTNWKIILEKCGWLTLIAFILFVLAAIAYKIRDSIEEKDDFDFYTIPELFLWTETADMITSFVNYNETHADLYLQYKKYKEDEEGEMIETTGVYVIEGFKVKRTGMSKEPILDINNGIYYVPYGYVNKRNNT